jgi:hypothetical protein
MIARWGSSTQETEDLATEKQIHPFLMRFGKANVPNWTKLLIQPTSLRPGKIKDCIPVAH